ncbi:MAG TPA: 50S ribosomal protein L22 [Limnochordales bacterium]
MEGRAVARYVRISPRKARQVTRIIKGKPVGEALAMLRFTPKRAARIVEKVVKSAAANAENNHDMNVNELVVVKAYVDEGPSLKRIMPRARGRADRYQKRMSHITIVVRERQ